MKSHTARVDQKVYKALKRLQRFHGDKSMSEVVRRLLHREQLRRCFS